MMALRSKFETSNCFLSLALSRCGLGLSSADMSAVVVRKMQLERVSGSSKPKAKLEAKLKASSRPGRVGKRVDDVKRLGTYPSRRPEASC